MKKILILIPLLLSVLQMAIANDKEVIILGMDFDSAKKILSTANATEQILQKMPPSPPYKSKDYEILDSRLLEIIYNSDTNKIMSLSIAETPASSKSERRWIRVEEVNLTKNDLKKYIAIADEEAEKILKEANENGLGPFYLKDYWIQIKFQKKNEKKIIEINYTNMIPGNFLGHPQHFAIWIYKDTMETRILKGR